LRLDKFTEILIKKKIPIYLINIIDEYLSNRSGYVEISESRSIVEPMNAGCVQGNIIGPLLLNILKSDFYSVIQPNSVVSYADDSYVVVKAQSREELQNQSRMCVFEHYAWLKSIGMVCNTEKTEMITFGAEDFEVEVNNVIIKPPETMKALGLIIDNKLSWEPHVTKIIQKHRSLLFCLSLYSKTLI